MKVTLATSKLLKEVMAERLRQEEKWGDQTHDIFTYPDTESERLRHEAAALQCKMAYDHSRDPGWDLILMEEVYEAFSETNPAAQREEFIQVAAVALAIVEDLDRKAKPL